MKTIPLYPMDDYMRGRAAAERDALRLLVWVVKAAGGEITVTPDLTLGRDRLERIDSLTTDQFTLRRHV